LELDAAVVVGLDGSGQIKVTHCNLLRALVEDVNSLSHDGVIGHFLLVAIAENQDDGLNRACVVLVSRRGRKVERSGVLVFGNDIAPRRRSIDDDVKRLLGRRPGFDIGPTTTTGVISVRRVVDGNVVGDGIDAAVAVVTVTVPMAMAITGMCRINIAGPVAVTVGTQRCHARHSVRQKRRDMELDGSDRGRNTVDLGAEQQRCCE